MKKVFEYVLLTIGSIIVAGSLELILAPNGLVDGGVTAIAIMANKVAGLPLYGVFLGINIPILLFTAKVMGKKFFIRTSYANVVTTLGLIYLKPFPAITTSELLIVLYGGVLFGVGVGIVVKMGGAIDGSEMLAVWMNKHFKVPISTFLLAVNAVIFTFVAILFSIEQAMFSLAIFYIVTKMIDFILDGINQGKSVMIISGKNKEIGDLLMKELQLSVTYLHGEGGFLGEHKRIIYCITNRFIYPKMKDLVLSVDPTAIIEASYSTETTGVKRPGRAAKSEK
ncbi:YitT family protein [Bacillus albus]|uniref:YitT family protein n=1 Tax=Bacillus TaxID=1386 RepID=UPI0014196614|nr:MULTISPECIES: YitT family protein [Bacillus]MBU5215601.1 YitT family protein [Bacillus albus]MDA2026372.1 YitT family protein [Bacillus cereus group sp. Bcc03]MDA2263300.1 YitT family protein [Bacillus cereus group sp. Bc200]MDA2322527.1 YitT family protein [Bacillus cereus group sp. Bc177]MDA2711891.1 YitT family protein [Bacillus cereus group sp. Bc025]